MKINKTILIVIGIVMVFFLTITINKCNNPKGTELVDILVPEKTGKFNVPPLYTTKENQKDSVIIKYKTVTKGDTVYKDSIVYTENPVNKQLVKQYSLAKDSIERYKMYIKAIEEREGTSTFDNDDLKVEVYTKTRGELLDIKIPSYTIKPRKVTAEIPKKETVFAMYAGTELISNNDLKLGVKADIGLQNRSGNMLTIGLDNNKNYYLGVKFKLFGIKR